MTTTARKDKIPKYVFLKFTFSASALIGLNKNENPIKAPRNKEPVKYLIVSGPKRKPIKSSMVGIMKII